MTTTNQPRAIAPSTNPNTARVREAIAVTEAMMPAYYRRMYDQRAGVTLLREPNPNACGSIYPKLHFLELYMAIELSGDWEPYTHPDVAPGCVAFATKIPGGQLGIVDLATLDPSTPVQLLDPKGSGFVEAVVAGVRGASTDLTVVILGEHEGREACFTFFPGTPVRPSSIPAAERHGTTITAADARQLGLSIAKIAG